LSDSDGDLLRKCRAGDQEAWKALVARHTRRVFGVAYRFLGRADEAEDLTQDVFVKVYLGLDRFREEEGAFGTWLTTVARNQAIDHYRRRREERLRRAEDPAILEFKAADGESQQLGLERRERVEFVRRGLRALPPDLREPIVLCDLQGLSYEEASASLGIPLGTVKSRINRGRLELAKRLMSARREAARP
jgi:RNA polymerase sigma-70 factor (ECF subfamily)